MRNRWLFALIVYRTKPNKSGPFAGWPFGFFGLLRYLWIGFVTDFRIWHLGRAEFCRLERARLDRALARYTRKYEQAARCTSGPVAAADRGPPPLPGVLHA